MMKVEIDEPLLQEIAKATDGKYFRATNNAKLRSIYKEIDSMEKSKIDVTEFHRRKEEFFPFVLVAFILIGVELLLRYLYLKNIP